MATIEPLRALRYDLAVTDGLQPVVAPPYDVIDAPGRAELEARSPYNVVRIDLPVGEAPYAEAAAELRKWRVEGAVVRDHSPALWALAQTYRGPDRRTRTRHGILARVRIEEYGAGRIRPHERTHPGPKEDRLRLMRATKANLSPIFSLFSDPDGAAWTALASAPGVQPWAETRDADGTKNRLWRVDDEGAIEQVKAVARDAELLIADGHHRYETARVYAEEVGGEGPHRYVLMCLVALEDPGLTVFPTHRMVRGLRPEQHEALADAIRQDFEVEPLIQELLKAGLLIEYDESARKYLHIKGFAKHQRIDRPSKPRHPSYEQSLNSQGPLDELSTSARSSKGMEGRGGERNAREVDIEKEFAELRFQYPAGIYRDTAWAEAARGYQRLREQGESHEALSAAVRAFSAQKAAKGELGTQWVLSPARFFTDSEWRGPFPLPANRESESEARKRRGLDAAWARVNAHVKAIGCSLQPYTHDSPDSFESRVKDWERRCPPSLKAAPVSVAALLSGGLRGGHGA